MSLTLLSKGGSVYSSGRRISNVWRTAGDPITFGPKELLAQSRDGQHLTRVDQVRIGNAAGIGDHLVFAAVAVEALRNGPLRIPRHHGVRPRSRRRRGAGAGSGSAAGAGSWTAAGTTSGAGACAAGGVGATGTSSVCDSTPTPARRIRTAQGCGRPAAAGEHPWRPWYPCARSAFSACGRRRARPFTPRGVR